MIVAAVQQVECVSGCGGSGLPSTPEVIGVAAALASLAVAFYALKISLGSLRIAEEQHSVFLDNLNAHADFKLEIHSPGEGGVIEMTSSRLKLIWAIHVNNTGDKAARHVHVAFGLPTFMREMQWEEGEKESFASEKGGPYPVREDLIDSEGRSLEAQVVTKRVPYIGRAGGFQNVSAILELENPGEERRVPATLLVRSDDLPDDNETVLIQDEVLVRRAPEASGISAARS